MRTTLVVLLSILMLFSSCLIMIMPNVSAIDEYKFSVNVKINDDTTTRDQGSPDIVVTSNGNIGVVWMDGRDDAVKFDIYFSKSTDSGNTFGDAIENTDVKINDDTVEASQKSPAIAEYNNDLYVVWTDSRNGFDHIWFAKSTNGGTSFNTNVKVDDATSTVNVGFPDIAVTSSGTVCVVWQDYRNGDNFDIYYAESTNGGVSFGASIRVDDTGSGLSEQKYPRIAVGDSGDKYIAWQDDRNGDYDIYFAHASATTPTTSFDSNVLVDDDAGTNEQSRVTIDGDGTSNVYVAWRDKRSASNGDIYFAKSTNKGVSFGTNVRVDDASTSTPGQDFPDLKVDADGNINVVWKDMRTSRGSRVNQRIYYANSTDGGSSFNTNLRVDNEADSDKSDPKIAYRGNKRFYIAWEDQRSGNRDIYFSRWAKASEMVGYAPTLTDGLVKNVDDNSKIGGVDDEFKYTIIYTDIENDKVAEAEGYPKLYIYTDESKTKQISKSPVKMEPSQLNNNDATDGETYFYQTTLPEEGNYYYQVEVKAETGNETIVHSQLYSGPNIDDTLPVFLNPQPSANKWHNSKSVNCSILISDQGGSGVESLSISYQYMNNGSDEWSRWFTNVKRTKVGDDYKVEATVTFGEGENNYIRWNATDKIGNKYGRYSNSEPFEVLVDTTPVKFSDPLPSDQYFQNELSIICSITINDIGGSGVNGSSIQYSFHPKSELVWAGPYSAPVNKIDETVVATTPAAITFENGAGNYIRWHVADIAGNQIISNQYEIKIDTNRPDNDPPEPPKSVKPTETKDSTPRIEWTKGSDADNDKLYYFIQIGTTDSGSEILEWTSTGTDLYYDVTQSLIVGKYYIQLMVNDGLDNSTVFQAILNITASGNDPPLPPTGIYPTVTSDHQPTINWTPSPSVGTLSYMIQIGTTSGADDIIPWTFVGAKLEFTPSAALSDGIYYIQVMSSNDDGTSFAFEDTIKIATFNPELEIMDKVTGKQGETITARLTIKNNATMDDTMTINLSGELVTKKTVTLNMNPKSPVKFSANETRYVTLSIALPANMVTGKYTLDIQVISEDGKSKSFTRTMTIEVKPKDSGNGHPNGGTNGDDGTDAGGIMDYLWLIIIIIIIIVVLGVVGAIISKSRQKKKEKDQFFKDGEDEYSRLYGPKKQY